MATEIGVAEAARARLARNRGRLAAVRFLSYLGIHRLNARFMTWSFLLEDGA